MNVLYIIESRRNPEAGEWSAVLGPWEMASALSSVRNFNRVAGWNKFRAVKES